MKTVYFQAIPFDKDQVTLALESGIDAVITSPEHADAVRALAKVEVLTPGALTRVALGSKADEQAAARALAEGARVVLAHGWEIIPVENLLAQGSGLGCEVASLDEARLAAGILERGVDFVVLLPEAAKDMKAVVADLKLSQGTLALEPATVTAVRPAGLGHRVCVDTMSMLRTGQGMLVGNSSAFTFLVHAETESNPYVAARPFRINAGAVHAYAVMPGDRTRYLEELASGDEVLIVGADGGTSLATVGRVKVEVRPMLHVTARTDSGREGAVFLQNAETIRVVREDGCPVSVVALAEGQRILVRTDEAGRHFGMRIAEDIKEG
ncbi:3-dehydroquinate synthase II family protein [Desulfocurvus sp.]|jgi:3-dehydroquinate synthase II|uniref:3-dehydroquinate synthase II family protein n=1 Tax=Desulfocurvus sp. TaxID=2871698 RepID=UPI0025C05EE7|nr:3-dehydroquinate synthase II family protein [Desulfocurvus sp.]MCK9239355.1 3-dehydroquinate synthase II family protein [Desulfocurvus sp.]